MGWAGLGCVVLCWMEYCCVVLCCNFVLGEVRVVGGGAGRGGEGREEKGEKGSLRRGENGGWRMGWMSVGDGGGNRGDLLICMVAYHIVMGYVYLVLYRIVSYRIVFQVVL